MGQKIHPHGLRVGVIKDWDSRWYADKKDFGDLVAEDNKLRKMLKEQLKAAGVPKIEIERASGRIRIHIFCARPGIVIGQKGAEIDKLRAQCEKLTGKPVSINVVEVKVPDADATLVAESIAQQLEKRVSFRRAMKNSISRAMTVGVKGIKVMLSGRVGGAEIARSEMYKEGTIPLQTIRADIDYGFAEAHTTYGIVGVKVWIYNGEVLKNKDGTFKRPELTQRKKPGDRRPRRRGDGNRRPARREGGENR